MESLLIGPAVEVLLNMESNRDQQLEHVLLTTGIMAVDEHRRTILLVVNQPLTEVISCIRLIRIVINEPSHIMIKQEEIITTRYI